MFILLLIMDDDVTTDDFIDTLFHSRYNIKPSVVRPSFGCLALISPQDSINYNEGDYFYITNKNAVVLTFRGSYVTDFKTWTYYPIMFHLFHNGYGYLYDEYHFYRIKDGKIEKTHKIDFKSYLCHVRYYNNTIMLFISGPDFICVNIYNENDFSLISSKTYPLSICYYSYLSIINEKIYYDSESGITMLDLKTNEHDIIKGCISKCFSNKNFIYQNSHRSDTSDRYNLIINRKISKIHSYYGAIYNDHIIILSLMNNYSIYNYKNQILYYIKKMEILGLNNQYILYQNNKDIQVEKFSYSIKHYINKKIQNTTYKHIRRLLI